MGVKIDVSCGGGRRVKLLNVMAKANRRIGVDGSHPQLHSEQVFLLMETDCKGSKHFTTLPMPGFGERSEEPRSKK